MTDVRKAYIALGSNIEPKLSHLQKAIDLYQDADNIAVTGISSVYDTVPKGYLDQDNFMNMAIEIETTLDAKSLLWFGQSVEKALHRVKEFVNGPRTIDCDILFIEGETFEDEDLIVPHPRMDERAFVLFPLAEIAAEVEVPGLDARVAALKEALPAEEKADVRKLGHSEELSE